MPQKQHSKNKEKGTNSLTHNISSPSIADHLRETPKGRGGAGGGMSGGVIWNMYIFNALLFHVGGKRTTLVNGGKGNRERENKGGGRVGWSIAAGAPLRRWAATLIAGSLNIYRG